MIFNLIIKILSNVLSLLLLPLEIIDIGIDFMSSFSFIRDFFRIAYFILPINNLKPLIFLIITINIFKIAISLIKTIWDLLPIL